MPQLAQKAGHAHQERGADLLDDRRVSFDQIESAADAGGADGLRAEAVGVAGDEAAVEGAGEQHPVAPSHAATGKADGLVVGEAFEVAAGVEHLRGEAGGPRRLHDVADAVAADRQKALRSRLQVGLGRERQVAQRFERHAGGARGGDAGQEPAVERRPPAVPQMGGQQRLLRLAEFRWRTEGESGEAE